MRTWLNGLFDTYGQRGQEELDIFNTTLSVIRTIAVVALLVVLIFK